MGSRAVKFAPRAPRYTLRPQDNSYMRFAPNNDNGHSYTTRFIDMSLTGLAFIVDREHAPRLSDLIKVEIPIEKDVTIAWWARVVRVEEYAPHKWYLKARRMQEEHQVLVALIFHELPPRHTRIIREVLDKKFAEMREIERHEKMESAAKFILERAFKVMLYLALVISAFCFLYYLTLPSPTYDANKGAPWGQRFPSLIWDDEPPKDSPEVNQ